MTLGKMVYAFLKMFFVYQKKAMFGCLESTISGMWYVEVVRCLGCRMLDLCAFKDLKYSKFRMFRMWDTGDMRC